MTQQTNTQARGRAADGLARLRTRIAAGDIALTDDERRELLDRLNAVGDDNKPFLDARQVAALLGISRNRVYELTDLLPHVRLGRRIRYSRRGLEALDEAAIREVVGARAPAQ